MKKISNVDLKELNKLVSIEKIRKVIEFLRDPENGCPWDLKQDYQSLAPYSLEEAYELVDAIESNNIDNIKNELGDLLLQVVLISQIAADRNDFNFDDVANEISNKIIRRHPQIFDHNYTNNDLPNESWERIKNNEQNTIKIKSKHILDNIETNIPSTLRSIKIQKKAASLNFDWKNKTDVLTKVDEELNELKEAIKNNNKEDIEEELGDLFFTLLNLSRHLKLDPDQTIRKANNKFILRFNTMENILDEMNIKWHNLEYSDFKKLWNKAKLTLKEDKNEF
jgi:nucleoside triphosphate diphosphatase